MKVNGTTALVVLGAAFAVWLAADAMSGNRDAALRSIERQPALDARGDVLAKEIARLHERLRAPGGRTRDHHGDRPHLRASGGNGGL